MKSTSTSTAQQHAQHVRRAKFAAAATLVAAAVGVTAGCAGQTAPASTGAAASTSPATVTSTSAAAVPTAPQTTAGASQTSPTPAATSSHTATVAVENCGHGPALIRPAALVLACADQGLQAKKLTWSNWSATSATATGVITWHVCTPSCAASTTWDSTSAQITLTDPVSESGKEILFTKLTMRVTGATPAGFTRVATYDMAPN